MSQIVRIFSAKACAAPLQEAADLFTERTGIAVHVGMCSRHCASTDAEEATGSAGSHDFLDEIVEEGDYDLAVSGAEYLLDDGEVRGVIAKGCRRFIALRQAALILPADNPKGIRRLEDLGAGGVRIAVSVLDCLKGVWEDVCARAGMLEEVRRNISFYANGCIAILEAVAQGKADAAFGWTAFAHLDPDRIRILPLPEHQSISRATSVGLLTGAPRPEAAQRLMDFLATAEARALYFKYGWVSGGTAGKELPARPPAAGRHPRR